MAAPARYEDDAQECKKKRPYKCYSTLEVRHEYLTDLEELNARCALRCLSNPPSISLKRRRCVNKNPTENESLAGDAELIRKRASGCDNAGNKLILE